MQERRTVWYEALGRVAEPVLRPMAEDRLTESFPFAWHEDRRSYALLEALGRTAEGIAPWLELEGLTGEEARRQAAFRNWTREAIARAVDPASRDACNFSEGYGQSLVDAAFLAHGIVRAPRELGAALDGQVRENLVRALISTRRLTPFVSNWVLFSAMVEAALEVLGTGEADMTRVDYAVQMMRRWYVGDGTYSDGDNFHWDYYNSFVIQPMLIDVLRVFEHKGRDYDVFLREALAHGARYAMVLEQLIAPDGTWAVFGRSSVYRCGCFQLLAQAALEHFLPEELPANQVRCALTAAVRRSLGAAGTLDEKGFLVPGIAGRQESLAEDYISVGSLYLCCAVFLPLGLPESDPFWARADRDWTARRIWSGEDVMRDHARD